MPGLLLVLCVHAVWNALAYRRLEHPAQPLLKFLLLNRPQRVPALHAAIILAGTIVLIVMAVTAPTGLEDTVDLLALAAAGIALNLVLDTVAFVLLRAWDRNGRVQFETA